MTRVLALVCGPTEVMHCAFVLHRLNRPITEAKLVLYGAKVSVPPALRTETLKVASLFYDWTSILDICDECDSIIESDPNQRLKTFAEIRKRIGESEVDLILAHSIDKLPERAILGAYPKAAIIVYDGGIYSYLPRRISRDNSAWKHILTVNAADIPRVEEAYFTLLGDMSAPAYVPVDVVRDIAPAEYRRRLEGTWERVAHLPDFRMNVGDSNCHVLLGSTFHRIGAMQYEDEREIYRRQLARVLEREADVVLFKGKPRQHRESFIDETKNVRVVSTHLAAEFLPLAYKVVGVSGMHSTALLTYRRLFGIEPEVLGRELQLADRIPQLKLLMQSLDGSENAKVVAS